MVRRIPRVSKQPRRNRGTMKMETRLPSTPSDLFRSRRAYPSLSIKDLFNPRETYHVYLLTLNNVLVTEVGHCFIHHEDWCAHRSSRPATPGEPRSNSGNEAVS